MKLLKNYAEIYCGEFDLNVHPRLKQIGFNQTDFLISVVDYYQLLINFIDDQSISKEIAQKIYSRVKHEIHFLHPVLSSLFVQISDEFLNTEIFFVERNDRYWVAFLNLMIKISSKPKMINYRTYHLLQ